MGIYNILKEIEYRGEKRVFESISPQFFKIQKPFEYLKNNGLKQYYTIEDVAVVVRDENNLVIGYELISKEIYQPITKLKDDGGKFLYHDDILQEIKTFATENDLTEDDVIHFVLSFSNKYYSRLFMRKYSVNKDIQFKVGDTHTFEIDSKVSIVDLKKHFNVIKEDDKFVFKAKANFAVPFSVADNEKDASSIFCHEINRHKKRDIKKNKRKNDDFSEE